MNLNDFSMMAAIQQRVKNLRGSEYFPYPLYISTNVCFVNITLSLLHQYCLITSTLMSY